MPGILFHVKHVQSAARYVGIELDDIRLDRLAMYRDWLVTEGRQAGGIGPAEIPRIERRHLADSLLFASVIDDTAAHVIDLGTGVGLPGIPLALIMPEKTFTLVDRSQRRVDLVRRVLRILEVENCEVLHEEIEDLIIRGDVVVSRAGLPPNALRPIVPRLLRPGGVAIVGGSWHEAPSHVGWETIGIPGDVLDRPVWLLMMRSA
jgi:16S rRNA (guanine(527)-N(7))-methyltransferase RsmG